jgi:cation diffusion facilitator family transporter
MSRTEDASLRTVVAVAVNLLVAVAKGVAALVTGSAAMLAETTHSVADTGNKVLLVVGVRRGARPADERHPFGYGQARYPWSLLAAVGIFVIGGLFAFADGVQTLRRPEPRAAAAGVAAEPWVAEVAALTAVYVGPRQLLVLTYVVPVDGADLTASVGRLRRRLLAVPAVAAVEITPVERAP